MSERSARASLAFSSIGHSFSHFFEPVFYIVALVLPRELGLSYEESLTLIIAGKLLFGLAAPLAGWLGDRWSSIGMMVVYFIGMGASAVLVGLAGSPMQIALALALVGLFGSIYHPVGIAWLVRNAVNRGKALGVNGLFGGLGPAAASLVAGLLIETWGWRSAFVVPGLVCVMLGLAFWAMILRGDVIELKADRRPQPEASRGETVKVGLILSLTMICTGLIYQATQPALPKLFDDRLGDIGVFGVSGAVMTVYVIAGLSQLLWGHLVDKVSARTIYLLAYVAQVPLLLLMAYAMGLPLLLVAVLAVVANFSGIPAENVLLSRYTPSKWRGTAFGLKFVLAFGVSGLGVPLVAVIHGATGGLFWLFIIMAALAAVVVLAGLLLPDERKDEVRGAPAPAE